MTTTSAKETVLAMIDAMSVGDFNKAISFYHDEIDFVGYAPVELFTKLGQRRGKTEVMQTMMAIHDLYVRRRTEIEFIAAEDNRVSVIICLHLQKRGKRQDHPASQRELLRAARWLDRAAENVSRLVRPAAAGAGGRPHRDGREGAEAQTPLSVIAE
jgi:hypothetical protein